MKIWIAKLTAIESRKRGSIVARAVASSDVEDALSREAVPKGITVISPDPTAEAAYTISQPTIANPRVRAKWFRVSSQERRKAPRPDARSIAITGMT